MPRDRKSFVDSVTIGNIVAFRIIRMNGEIDMYSGKVIDFAEDGRLIIMTKNGSVYFIDRNDVVWVKNGTRYPAGIHNAIKYTMSKGH